MNARRVCRFLGLLAAFAAGLVPALASAQGAASAWPARPIRLVVPFVAGGGADVAARLIAAKLQMQLGQQVVVDNKPGGNTLIGAQELMKAPPDGYTLLWSIDQTFVLNPSLYNRLPYDPRKDFTPVALAITSPTAVIARTQAGSVGDVHELVKRARAEPGKINIGAAAILSQMALEEFNRSAGIEITRVPYKGSAEVAQATIAGDIDAAFDGMAPYVQFVKAGRAKILAVTSARRFSGLPDVPTLDELGYKGVDFSVWFGVVGPAGLPPEIAKRVSDGVDWAIRQPDVVEKLLVFGFEPAAQTSVSALKGRIDSDLVRYSPVIKKLGFKLD
ncbi:Bug family tripartite tricarboxylate transporter substrate binding protein [Acidovorax cavernicola]|uniref:Tripartite tricarboxylate transporter substrate binding protein n=1 Tax=Acidovorax cavernicola TaxID=1675792 RepID=A0A9X8D561_9BURK|nr:tripartite tricarboxylate transporter substrate binding protein [Acidovorax cavernicola]RIX80263.1 tripartite tricarboxylate transporter substrate binding protein [Acidovorax cavernicola]